MDIFANPLMLQGLGGGLILGFIAGWYAHRYKEAPTYKAIVKFAKRIEEVLPDDSPNPLVRTVDEFLDAVVHISEKEEIEDVGKPGGDQGPKDGAGGVQGAVS